MKAQAAAVSVLSAAITLFAPLAAAQTAAVLTVSNGLGPTSKIVIQGDVPMMLLRQSFSEVLKRAGLTLEGWESACRVASPACAQAVQGVVPVLAAAAIMQGPDVKFDPLPAGTYYLFALGAQATDPVVWDVRVDLRAGANALKLDERNITKAAGPAAGSGTGRTGMAAATPVPVQVPVSPAPAVDPSIAKARAAKVDTRVFGIPLGEPLRLPKCQGLGGLLAGGLSAVKEDPTCLNDMSADFLAAFLPADLVDLGQNNLATIQLHSDSCPAWLSACIANATLHNGTLVRIEMTTKGRGVEQATGTELRGKYGPPTSSKVGSITPDVGNPFNITDLTWTLPGLHVEFQPVRRMEDDPTRVKTNEGMVLIETEQAYQLRQTEAKQKAKPKL